MANLNPDMPELLVPREQLSEEIADRINSGNELTSRRVETPSSLESLKEDYLSWTEYNSVLLRRSFTTSDVVDEYISGRAYVGNPQTAVEKYREIIEDISADLRRLRSIQGQLGLFAERTYDSATTVADHSGGQEVFIVHGHSEAPKLSVARLIQQVTGREPIILHEKVNSGRTVIEKFEDYASNVGFAVVLLTRDDEGRQRGASDFNARARQNVIFELGFFIAKLGRNRVAALHESGVEVPSDISGVLYTSLDSEWRLSLTKEMRAAGIEVDMDKL